MSGFEDLHQSVLICTGSVGNKDQTISPWWCWGWGDHPTCFTAYASFQMSNESTWNLRYTDGFAAKEHCCTFSTKLLSCYIIIHLAYLCGVRVHLEIFPAFQKEREEQEQVWLANYSFLGLLLLSRGLLYERKLSQTAVLHLNPEPKASWSTRWPRLNDICSQVYFISYQIEDDEVLP